MLYPDHGVKRFTTKELMRQMLARTRKILFLPALLLGLAIPSSAQENGSPHVVFLVGEREYGSAQTMPRFLEVMIGL